MQQMQSWLGSDVYDRKDLMADTRVLAESIP